MIVTSNALSTGTPITQISFVTQLRGGVISMIKKIYKTTGGAWYDPNPSTTYATYGGVGRSVDAQNYVANMTDLSGNIDTALQSNHTYAPLLQGNAIAYDGSSQYLYSQSGAGASYGFFLCLSFTMTSGNNTNRTLWSDSSASGGFNLRINTSNNAEFSMKTNTGTIYAASSDILTIGTTYVVNAWYDGVNEFVQINNNGTASAGVSGFIPSGGTQFTMARDNNTNNNYFAGNIGEVIYTKNNALTATQRLQIKNFVASKAGGVLTPAASTGALGSTFKLGTSALA